LDFVSVRPSIHDPIDRTKILLTLLMKVDEGGKREFRVATNEECGRRLVQDLCSRKRNVRAAIEERGIRIFLSQLVMELDRVRESGRLDREADIVRFVSAHDCQNLFW